MDSVKERLKAFIEYKKISIRSFENRCGLSYGNYGSVFKSSGIVSIPAKVWDVIEKQADSLKSKDKQIDDLISLLKGLIQK